ncbi:hypothetical protein [Sphingomicrobium aestuariivivum]|uniref:hypothetical protein n=1 Tax=Sphingomicrobium aestuariivivum TaxID=1582356 RepID=UPI001FD67977|nr:hypothetical protein [Sphingomicrobium aestuariivivum]MCJ8190049.1 hypothetical protein [Sphingomicrobium aestuariivivum]
MAQRKDYEARVEHFRARAETAVSGDVKWLYEDMARHYERLIKRGAYDAEARADPFTDWDE